MEHSSKPVFWHDCAVVALVSSAHSSSHFYQLIFPSLLPWLMPEFGLSYTEAGVMMTLLFVTSALGQFGSGFLVDKVGAKMGLYIGLGLLAVSSLILGIADSKAVIVAMTLVSGLGNSVFNPADYTLLNCNIAKPHLGHAFAWHGIAGSLGWAVCPLLMTGIATAAGWRAAAFTSAGLALAVLAAIWLCRALFPNERAGEEIDVENPVPTHARQEGPFAFLRYPAVWLCFLFFFFTTAAWGVLESYGPMIFGTAYGLGLAAASSAITAYVVGSMVGGVAGGFLTGRARLPEDHVVGVSLAFAAAMALVLALQWLPGLWAVALMAMMGFGCGVATPSRDIMIRQVTIGKMGSAALGRVYGFTYCGMDVGQSVAPLVFGPMLDRGLFGATLAGVAVLQCCAILTALLVGGKSRRTAPAPRGA